LKFCAVFLREGVALGHDLKVAKKQKEEKNRAKKQKEREKNRKKEVLFLT
jgi:hypothetical protein